MKTHLIFLFSCLFFSVLHAQTEKGRYIIGSSTNIAGGNLPLEFYLPSEHNNLGIGFGTVHTEYKRSDGTVVKSSEKLNSFNISPVFGYFVAENLALGGNLSAQSVWTKDDYSTASVTGFSYGPFVRYYFQANTWRPYAEIRGGGAVIKQKYHDKSGTEDDSTDKSNTYYWGGKLGVAYFLSGKNVSLDAFMDYSHTTLKDKSDTGSSELKTTFGMVGFGLGFSIFL